MKILLTGGGTGGHFYPLIAVAEELNKQIKEEKILHAELLYMAPSPYDKEALYENGISFVYTSAGKLRVYPSLKNVSDVFKTAFGVLGAIVKMYRIFPDVVFSKGGYASFPALLAARILGIPVIIHESDTVPGRVNRWAGKFAKYIAISYREAAEHFPKEKVAWTGQPIRGGVQHPVTEGAHEYLKLDPTIPVLFVLGGSQGAKIINEAIVEALPKLLRRYQVIHQTGTEHLEWVREEAGYVLQDSPYADRHKTFGFLNELAIRMAAGAADVVLTRAGSTLFEVAAWGIPAIVVPFTKSNGDHAKRNAFAYARAGAGVVLTEDNLSTNIILTQLDLLSEEGDRRENMIAAAKRIGNPEASEVIAKKLLEIGLEHEK